MNRLCRLAREAGILVVGVGMGSGARFVKTAFVESVWSNSLSELPPLLVRKVKDIVNARVAKRGAKIKGM